MSRTNENFYRDKAHYIATTSLLAKVGFYIKNTGPVLASNTTAVIQGTVDPDLLICDPIHYPEFPRRELFGLSPISLYNVSSIGYDVHGLDWTLTVPFRHIQPKAPAWSDGSFYIGATKKTILKLSAVIYADNLSDPFTVPLSVTIDVRHRPLDLSELDKELVEDDD